MSTRAVPSLPVPFHEAKVSCSTLLLRAMSTTVRNTMMKSFTLNRIESPPLTREVGKKKNHAAQIRSYFKDMQSSGFA